MFVSFMKISACWLLHCSIKFNKICWEKRPVKPRPNLRTSFCRRDLKNTQPHINRLLPSFSNRWCILIPYLVRYLEIFKKPNFQVVKCKPTFIWKMRSQAELETEGSGLATMLGLLRPTGTRRGYRDSARLLDESCADKKWGATSEKNCTEIEK